MASTVFSETLQSITTTKLTELSKKRSIFEESKSSLLVATQGQSDQKERLKTLVAGVRKCFALKAAPRDRGDRQGSTVQIVHTANDPKLEVLLKNLERFLDQAKYDPTISSKLLQNWEDSLLKRLNVQSLKYQYASLYGELVTEWLRAERSSIPDNISETSEGFEKIKPAQRDESRTAWEKLVFEPFETDQMAILEYLRALFGETSDNKQGFKALQKLHKEVEAFEASLASPNQFNETVLRWVIGGLVSSVLLNDEKRGALKDFLGSPVILAEIADVLNMRIADISEWSWDDEVLMKQRRQVTGTYRIYIDEELLQAIFLQYVGVKWCIFFKEALVNFSNFDGAWTSLRPHVPLEDRKRREYFMGAQWKKCSVQAKRQSVYKSIFFMSQLQDGTYEENTALDGEEEANYEPAAKRQRSSGQPMMQPQMQQMQQQQMMAQQQAQHQQQAQTHALQDHQMQLMLLEQQNKRRLMMARQEQDSMMPAQTYNPASRNSRHGQPETGPHRNHNSDEYDVDLVNRPKSPIATKQFLLHLLSTEVLVNTRLNGDFTCSRSEFQSFSPSLPHSTITSVLGFFGLSDKWLGFFRKFLEAPLKFADDDSDVAPRPRKRGVPGSHALSTICGEAILFCLDYAVNQSTNGAQLFRMHDDFWIWSSSHETVVKGWACINIFAEVMGVTLNHGKTGTVRIKKDTETSLIDPSLPVGEIRWGFLVMDPSSGRFVIDQDMVDTHILELERQLAEKDKSVFSWIQTWNTYAGTFFKSNFGTAANCFGQEHVDMMLSTMARIQKRIFRDSNVVEYLKNTLNERFSIDDIPDGFLYFPTSLGGLELQNPFVGLVQVRNAVFEHPASVIDDFFEAEAGAYRRAKATFENGKVHRQGILDPNFRPADGQTFMSMEEYIRYREEYYSSYEGNLLSAYTDLLQKPEPQNIDISDDETSLLDKLSGIGEQDEDYMKWVALLYGPDMVDRFGGLKIVEKGLLPMGMVTLFRSGRVKWQG
ncbi:hypothetical protein VTL71DRAFT_13405 [Oculimacula yallundae]|uniref:Reverse transcriptase domain-containing protein n=1 Tax=Oculimacula yallundae TaxID=86028 RepID=A0ABR4CKU1_9HELO